MYSAINNGYTREEIDSFKKDVADDDTGMITADANAEGGLNAGVLFSSNPYDKFDKVTFTFMPVTMRFKSDDGNYGIVLGNVSSPNGKTFVDKRGLTVILGECAHMRYQTYYIVTATPKLNRFNDVLSIQYYVDECKIVLPRVDDPEAVMGYLNRQLGVNITKKLLKFYGREAEDDVSGHGEAVDTNKGRSDQDIVNVWQALEAKNLHGLESVLNEEQLEKVEEFIMDVLDGRVRLSFEKAFGGMFSNATISKMIKYDEDVDICVDMLCEKPYEFLQELEGFKFARSDNVLLKAENIYHNGQVSDYQKKLLGRLFNEPLRGSYRRSRAAVIDILQEMLEESGSTKVKKDDLLVLIQKRAPECMQYVEQVIKDYGIPFEEMCGKPGMTSAKRESWKATKIVWWEDGEPVSEASRELGEATEGSGANGEQWLSTYLLASSELVIYQTFSRLGSRLKSGKRSEQKSEHLFGNQFTNSTNSAYPPGVYTDDGQQTQCLCGSTSVYTDKYTDVDTDVYTPEKFFLKKSLTPE